MKKIIAILMVAVMLTFAFSASAAEINHNQTEEIQTMQRTIPEGAFLYKEGLYVYEKQMNVGSLSWTIWELYSADGWCFYDLTQPENYDEDGNLLPENQRVYAQFMSMRKNEQYVTDNIISVPVQEGYEIVSVGGNNHETV